MSDKRGSKSKSKSNPEGRAAGAEVMGGDEEEEETPHRLIVAQMI